MGGDIDRENGGKSDRDCKGRFVKGNPGAGRPIGSVSLVGELRRQLAKDKNAEAFVASLLANAMKGNPQAIKQILDRIEGPVAQELSVKTEQGPLVVKFADELKTDYSAVETSGPDSDSGPSGPV